MMGFSTKKLELKGQALIGSVIGKFSEMIESLERGVEECSEEQSVINSQIFDLEAKNSRLEESVTIGTALCNKLADLMK